MHELNNTTGSSLRMGVTCAIRAKLNFQDERLWKRFSARRLELIDTLDLSLRKALEQEDQIKLVAEALRQEFEYTDEYKPDFDKLVRAAVQSVRRNRKRLSRSKRDNGKRQKRKRDIEENYQTDDHEEHEEEEDTETDTQLSEPAIPSDQFLSEIVKLKTENNQVYDMSYSKMTLFTDNDRAKVAIDSMIRPRLTPYVHEPRPSGIIQPLPPISNLQITNIQDTGVDAFSAKATLINYIERSKSCSESVSRKSDNLQVLGESTISTCISYVFEKSFGATNQASIEYLRSKLNDEAFLAKIFRSLDPSTTLIIADDIALISLRTLLGGCIKDFGFESILLPMCEIIYVSIVQDYPLISKNLTPFKGANLKSVGSDGSFPPGFSDYEGRNLTSLAAVATEMQNSDDDSKKKVTLRFLNSVLQFKYTTENSAPPRYVEILENACSAFKLNMNDSTVCLRSVDGMEIRGDLDLERIFRSQQLIELEIFTQRSKAMPIHEVSSAVIPSHHQHLYPEPRPIFQRSIMKHPQPFMKHPLISQPLQQRFESSAPGSARIRLPPPVANRQHACSRCESEVIPHSAHHQYSGISSASSSASTPFNFLTNESTPPPPPPPLLPRFQPLL